MSKHEPKVFLNGVRNDLKIGIDDSFDVLESVYSDVRKLKLVSFKPDSSSAKGLLEYLRMEEGRAKENMKEICGKEIELYLEWLRLYCEDNNCNEEQALQFIIDREI